MCETFEEYLDKEIEKMTNEANQLLFAHHQRIGSLNKLLEVKKQLKNGKEKPEETEGNGEVGKEHKREP